MTGLTKCYQHRQLHSSTLLRHFEHTIDRVSSKHLTPASTLCNHPPTSFSQFWQSHAWVCRFHQETDQHEKCMNNQTSPPYCSSHICSSDDFDTAGNEFKLVPMNWFVHFFATYSFLLSVKIGVTMHARYAHSVLHVQHAHSLGSKLAKLYLMKYS